jgi:hypothetical protein
MQTANFKPFESTNQRIRLWIFSCKPIQFYLEYQNVLTVSGQISRSHYCELLVIEDITAHAQNSIFANRTTRHTRPKFAKELFSC